MYMHMVHMNCYLCGWSVFWPFVGPKVAIIRMYVRAVFMLSLIIHIIFSTAFSREAICYPKSKQYAEYLRKVYRRSKLPIKGKWPPAPCKKIIKLATIERNTDESKKWVTISRCESIDEYVKKNSMCFTSINDLLVENKDKSVPKIVIVQGVPGIGKSTFAWKFCRKWAKGTIYQQYKMVVLLRMRDTRVREAVSLSDLLFSESQEQSKAVAEEIIACGGKGVLFILEGIDELPRSCFAENKPLLNLIEGISLPEVTLIVTTRPWAVQNLIETCGDQISRIIEILGFTKEDILRYVSHAFNNEEQKDFLEYLRSYPHLESIMHIPLNAAFAVHIYRQFRSDPESQKAIPHTMTQLYTALVKGLLVRYVKSNPRLGDLKFSTLDSLPQPLNNNFEHLCALAFLSFTKVTIPVAFTESEASLYGCLDSLGLMQSSANLSIDTGTTVTHSFLHFTIQEFLAAYHLSKQPNEVQKLFVKVHLSDPQFSLLIRFLYGLNDSALQNICIIENVISSTQLHWLYESQSGKKISQILRNRVLKFIEFQSVPLDIYALTYCVCHSNCKWKASLDLTGLTSVYPVSKSNLYSGSFDSLEITASSGAEIKIFFFGCQEILNHLTYLHIRSDDVSTYQSIVEVVSSGMLQNLKTFGLYQYQDLLGKHIAIVIEALRRFGPQLIEFTLSGATLVGVLSLCEYINHPKCPKKFDLQNVVFEGDNLQFLISAVACSKYLSELKISRSHLSFSDIELLSVALSENSNLKVLTMFACSINGEGAELIANGMEQNHTLLELYLEFNEINNNGGAALASMLTVNNTLKVLSLLLNESLGIEGIDRLCKSMLHNNTLSKLYLPTQPECVEELFPRNERIYFS